MASMLAWLIALFLESTHKSRPYIFGRALLFVNHIFFQQKCKFSNQIHKHDFENSTKSWGIIVYNNGRFDTPNVFLQQKQDFSNFVAFLASLAPAWKRYK